MVRLAWLPQGLALWLMLAGCEASKHDVALASTQAEPHVAAFAKFDGWARRASQGRNVLSGDEALRETLFAPVRNERRVLAAWVERDGARPQQLSLPRDLGTPTGQTWVALRMPEVGEVQVAVHSRCPLDLPSWWRGDVQARPCVLIRREQGELRVTAAFARPAP